MKPIDILVIGALFVLTFVSLGCDDHTVDFDGVMHAPGYENPMANCASCHGSDLRGSGDAPSCFDCHDETNWEQYDGGVD